MAAIDITTIGGKSPGQLIRSNDWNALVATVASLQAQLSALSASVDQRFADVTHSLQSMAADLAADTARIAALETTLKDYYRVRLSSSQTIYAIGELAIVTVQVTDLAGKPITFADANRPWLTFLASWGTLQADTGFDVLGVFGDRSISVRTNAQGLCRIRLQPDHVDGFPIPTLNEVHKSLTATLQSGGKSVAELIRTSPTPVAMKATGAFPLLSTEYERSDAANMRQFVDAYYQRSPENIVGRVIPVPQIWRDYRASVICFATVGTDPQAGDFNRGTGSIAVDFRDWIEPWYALEYSVNTAPLLPIYTGRLTPKITNSLDESVNLLQTEVHAITAGGGLLKQRRDYDVINQALDQINVAQPPAFLNTVTTSVKNAIQLQQTLSTVPTVSTQQGVAFDVLTRAATRGDVSVATVNTAVGALQTQVAQTQQNFSDIGKQVTTLQTNLTSTGTRLDAALADGGVIHNLQADVSAVKGQVGTLQLLNLNPTDIKTKLDLVTSLDNRVGVLETKK
jgi:hypothetical protein